MKQTLSTNTTVSQTGNILSLYTVYGDVDDSILAFISNEEKIVNFVSFEQGEGGITKEGYTDINIFFNNKGELIISGDDTDRFDINEDGNLTITE